MCSCSPGCRLIKVLADLKKGETFFYRHAGPYGPEEGFCSGSGDPELQSGNASRRGRDCEGQALALRYCAVLNRAYRLVLAEARFETAPTD